MTARVHADGRPLLLIMTTSPMALSCFFATLVGHIRDRGFAVTALCSSGPELEDFVERSGVTVTVVPMKRPVAPLADIVSLIRVWRAIARLRPEIVHTHTPKAGLLGMAGAWAARVPVRIYTINGLPLMTRTGWRRRMLIATERVSCALATRVLCVSGSMRDAAVELGLCSEAKTLLLGRGSASGVDLTLFQPAAREPSGIVGFVGRLTRDKGIEVLADTWKLLRAQFPELRLWLCGVFEEEDRVSPAVRAGLEADPRVRIFRAAPAEMPGVYRSFDVCVLPTYREGLPNVAIECGAMKVPLVASAVPGCVDTVIDEETGLLVPPGDPAALAAATARLLGDPELRARLGEAARRFVEANFDERMAAQSITSAYRRELEAARCEEAARSIGKRSFDVVVSLVLLVVLFPVLLVVAILVRWRLGAPALFRQSRAGLGGRPFEILKFRTMTSERGPDGELLADSQRLTRLGRVLRQSSLDELPQLWNVWKGEMSLVGPRPLYAHYVERYDETQRRRLLVKPGITGWAQVSGRNRQSWEQRFASDVWYVDHRSFALDLRILALTVWRVVRRDGISEEGGVTMAEFSGTTEGARRP